MASRITQTGYFGVREMLLGFVGMKHEAWEQVVRRHERAFKVRTMQLYVIRLLKSACGILMLVVGITAPLIAPFILGRISRGELSPSIFAQFQSHSHLSLFVLTSYIFFFLSPSVLVFVILREYGKGEHWIFAVLCAVWALSTTIIFLGPALAFVKALRLEERTILPFAAYGTICWLAFRSFRLLRQQRQSNGKRQYLPSVD
jgi:hypothetical protein